jgi:hypothetical protein
VECALKGLAYTSKIFNKEDTMAYGTTLDSLNEGILREGMAKGQREDSFRNYLLGLAGERNRGRQVDVNAMDAGTRREGLGVTERLGNRQWDTEGRRVDVLGRDVDMRDRLGGRQYDTEAERIRAMERMNERNAGVTGKYYDAIANPRPSEGLVVDVLTRNADERDAFTKAPFVADLLNKEIDDSGWFTWSENPEAAAESALNPEHARSLRHLVFDTVVKRWKVNPNSAPSIFDPRTGSPIQRPPAPAPQPAPTPAPQPGPVADVLTPPAQNPPASRPIQPGVVAYGGFGLPSHRSDPSTNAPPGRQVRRLVILPDGTTALE